MKSPGLRSLGLKSSWLKSLGLKNLGLESSWLKGLGLKGLELKLGVEKSGVEMSFNPALIKYVFFRDTGVSLQIQMYQLYSEIFVAIMYPFLTFLQSFLNESTRILVGRVILCVIQFIVYVVQPLFYLHGDPSFRKSCMDQGKWYALKKALFKRERA